jgi:hypothetical protein
MTPRKTPRQGTLNPNFGQSLSAAPNLQAHRDFMVSVGKKISGRTAIQTFDDHVLVYRTPHQASMTWDPDVQSTDYGRVVPNEEGKAYAIDAQGHRRLVIAFDPEDAFGYLTDVYHLVSENRRELAMTGNAKLASTSVNYTAPSGALGGLVKEYDKLLDQIKQEHFDLKRHVERSSATYHGG